jgi:hypothetical protein
LKMALIEKLTSIADAIREKTGKAEKLTLDTMPTEILSIETGTGSEDCNGLHIPESALVVSGDCEHRFSKGGWDWFIDEYGDRITTKDISRTLKMFNGSGVSEIPFDINLANVASGVSCTSMFDGCSSLRKPPYIKGKIIQPEKLFSNCTHLSTIPDDWADYIDWSYMNDSPSHSMTNIFNGCNSLRKIPDNLISHLWNGTTGYYYCVYYGFTAICYVLEEIKKLPVNSGRLTTNCFNGSFSECNRLASLTFATNEDGTANTVEWKSQVINLQGQDIGYARSASNIKRNSAYHGITEATQVTDDSSYQALKDNPDWWTADIAYSRYNHDSAVETINSLPDTSAYLAANGGTNTIKFDGAAGSATDGGAINTLTEAEIAVAAAKGWTVTIA